MHIKYTRYSDDITDIFSHLTNVAIQKTAENYDERTGGKMELQALKLYLMSIYGVNNYTDNWRISNIFNQYPFRFSFHV